MLRSLRQIHLYFGVFIAPALIFFAITGALQTFNLHESRPGSDYKPSVFIMKIAQIHKNQTWILPHRRPRPAEPAAAAAPAAAPPTATPGAAARPSPAAAQPVIKPAPRPGSHLPLKIFFLIVSIGLFTSTLTGIYMAYKYNRSRLLITALLIVGTVLPLVLLPF